MWGVIRASSHAVTIAGGIGGLNCTTATPWALSRITWVMCRSGTQITFEAVRAIERVAEGSAYPGFSTDPVSAFRELRQDLQRFGRAFLKGTVDEFRELKRWVDDHPRPTGFTALPR